MGIKYKDVIDSFDKIEVEVPKCAVKCLEIKETPFVFTLIEICWGMRAFIVAGFYNCGEISKRKAKKLLQV